MKNKIIPVMLLAGLLFTGCNQDSKDSADTNTTQTAEEAKTDKNDQENKEDKKDKKDDNKADLDDKTVAIVNDEKISKDEYKKEIGFYGAMLASQQNLKSNIIQMMVQDKLISNDLKNNDIKIDDKEVNDNFMQSVQNFGGQEAFDKMLDDYNLELDQFKETVRKDLMYRKHKEWFEENNEISDEELKNYYEDNKDEFIKADAAHILVEDEETANEIKQRLDDGEDFKALAEEYSIDTASAKNGGELGKFGKGQMIKEFEDKVFSMKDGEISQPVQTEFGYHIIKLNSISDSLEDSKEEITKKLKDKKYQDYIVKLHDDANVVTEGDVTNTDALNEENVEDKGKEQTENEDKDAQDESEDKEETENN